MKLYMLINMSEVCVVATFEKDSTYSYWTTDWRTFEFSIEMLTSIIKNPLSIEP